MIQNGCNLSYLGICVYAKGRVPSSNKRTNKQVAEPPIYKLPKVRDAFQRKTKRNVWDGRWNVLLRDREGPQEAPKFSTVIKQLASRQRFIGTRFTTARRPIAELFFLGRAAKQTHYTFESKYILSVAA